MLVKVIYDSLYGNTEKIAQVIGNTLLPGSGKCSRDSLQLVFLLYGAGLSVGGYRLVINHKNLSIPLDGCDD